MRLTCVSAIEPIEENPETLDAESASVASYQQRCFILDALGLHRDQLLRTPDEHKRNPNKWWLDLAENDDARERLFHVLSEKRVIWSGKTRIAIGRALEDL
ncbi:unnamed protein product [Cylicocyclus nassatus]|uniref:Uncharacterized protein n=1 Tax=Cylicocyclus nassatus TaxID=53992 RepID=A0AA36M4A0_CYLNA|nr:unnamed protein product [Cylicocyclus nassatus]